MDGYMICGHHRVHVLSRVQTIGNVGKAEDIEKISTRVRTLKRSPHQACKRRRIDRGRITRTFKIYSSSVAAEA